MGFDTNKCKHGVGNLEGRGCYNCVLEENDSLRRQLADEQALRKKMREALSSAKALIGSLKPRPDPKKAEANALLAVGVLFQIDEALSVAPAEALKAEVAKAVAITYKSVGRRFADLLKVSEPADHIKEDEVRSQELAIYRSESKFWYGKAREIEAAEAKAGEVRP